MARRRLTFVLATLVLLTSCAHVEDDPTWRTTADAVVQTYRANHTHAHVPTSQPVPGMREGTATGNADDGTRYAGTVREDRGQRWYCYYVAAAVPTWCSTANARVLSNPHPVLRGTVE